ncbi:MAG: Hsp20/alpha crystallin family protein [Gammaproteobacteria bacterium]|nr:Hsp20/alpha crystallin family protein [Gammaproteobacteria bacterium]MBT8105917.1 Hsp20/alpha crystallin family protein [Gammaproteobacteria bacterium]NNF49452.1 Hsp20/alpha crystallin family protein [Woeseiaceae bacterium]NNK25931.1 Hsp20/alpha crystallin family protein [Woeseiaceae bacterium]NNL63355.1 Hsp20/alpha crystallin family protein [Woeseiaceae bacterium]
MSILRKIEPRKGVIDVRRTTPLTHSMEEFFEDFPPRRWMETFEPLGWKRPIDIDYERAFRLDVIDRDKELIVRAELPGVEKEDVTVEIAGDRLLIEAERKFEEEEEKETFYRHEVGYGKLVRTVALPDEVDADKVQAELKEGILSIHLPKIRVAEKHTVKVA